MTTISVDPAALRVIDANLVHALDLGADLLTAASAVRTRTSDAATSSIAAEADGLLAAALETGIEAARDMLRAAEQYEVAGEAGGPPAGPQSVTFSTRGWDLSAPAAAAAGAVAAAPAATAIDPTGATTLPAGSAEETGVWAGDAGWSALLTASPTSAAGPQPDLAADQKAFASLLNGPLAAAGGALVNSDGVETSLLENATRGDLLHRE